jgi:hypothetical protein
MDHWTPKSGVGCEKEHLLVPVTAIAATETSQFHKQANPAGASLRCVGGVLCDELPGME